jgi:hypothetical protein
LPTGATLTGAVAARGAGRRTTGRYTGTGRGATTGGGGGGGAIGVGGGGGAGGGGATKFCATAGTSHATAKIAAATGVGQRFLTRLCRKTPPQNVYLSRDRPKLQVTRPLTNSTIRR